MIRRWQAGWLVLLAGCAGEPEYPFCSEILGGGPRPRSIQPEVVVDDQGGISFDWEAPVHSFAVLGPSGQWLMRRYCEEEERGMPCIEPPVTYPFPERIVPGREYRMETSLWCLMGGNDLHSLSEKARFTLDEDGQPL